MVDDVVIELHHGGFLSKEPPYKYEGGLVDTIINVGPNKISYFELIDIVEKLGYPSTSQIFYKLHKKGIDEGLVLIEDDKQVMEMMEAYKGIEMWPMYVNARIGPINMNGAAKNRGGSGDRQHDGDDTLQNDAGLEGEGSDDGEEVSILGPDEDGDDLISDNMMKHITLKPWMVEGLEGAGDEDIFAPRKDPRMESIILASPISEVKHTASNRKVKAAIKKQTEKGIEVEETSSGEEELDIEASMELTTQASNEKALDSFDFLTDEEDQFAQLSDNGEDCDKRWPKFHKESDMEDPTLVVGMRFENAKVFRDVVVEWNVRRWCDIQWIRNESKRMLAKCRRDDCKWRIFASPMQGKTTLQIKTFNSEHTCQPKFENSLVTSTYISKRYFDLLSDNPNWRIKSMKKTVRRQCKVDVGNMKLYRAKTKAAKINEGDLSGQYSKLWDYSATIKKHNPSNTYSLLLTSPRTGQQPHFRRFYVCIEALKKGFLSGCRRIIGLDGCFLKGVFGGQMLSAIGRDGNDNIYPIAWAVVEIESKDSWNWFMSLLVHDLGQTRDTDWTFISDRQKGLLDVFKGLLPSADHRYCVKHLYANVTAKYKGLELQDLVWNAAYASTPRDFTRCMENIKKVDGKAYEYLNELNPKCWSRSYFNPNVKCDVLVNNLNESWNSYILEARDMPIQQLLEWIRRKIMIRIRIKKEGMEKHNGLITPQAFSILNDNMHQSRNCFAHYAGDLKFKVDHYNTTKVVDLASRTCSCREWDLRGIPCKHAIAAIQQTGHDPASYVHGWFIRDLYLKTYSFALTPLLGQEDWEITNNSPILPPYHKKPSGRPKKQRKRQPEKPRPGNRVQKKGGFITCSKCLIVGHNARTCKRAVHKYSRFMQSNTSKKVSSSSNAHAAEPSEVSCTPTALVSSQPSLGRTHP